VVVLGGAGDLGVEGTEGVQAAVAFDAQGADGIAGEEVALAGERLAPRVPLP